MDSSTASDRVVVGFDGSDDAVRALRCGARQALKLGLRLEILHAVDDTVLNSVWGVVFDPSAIREAADLLLEGAVAEAVAQGVPADQIGTIVELGNPAAGLARLSESARLIVVGRTSVENPERSFVGSTTVGVVGTSRCPVIVTGAADTAEGDKGVIGVGVTTVANRGGAALEWALRRAETVASAVKVLSVCPAPHSKFFKAQQLTADKQSEAVEVTTARVAAMVAPLRERFEVPIGIEVSYGAPLDLLVAASAELDLLVVEVHAAFPTYAVGGLVRGLMAHAHCPVATIRVRAVAGT